MIDTPADRCKMPPAFWRGFAELGLRPAVILRQARLPATLHLQPHAFYTTAQFFSVWEAVEKLSLDPTFSLKLVKAMDTSGHQPAFLAACYAADYRDGIARIDRFKRNSPSERFHFEERNGEFSISKKWAYATAPEPPALVDSTFAYLLELGRRGIGHHVVPIGIELTRSGPESEAYLAHFGCPIRYGASHDTMVLKSSDLDRPFAGHNLEFLDLLTPALAAARNDLDAESSLSDQVKIVLKRGLASGRPEVANIAGKLGTSERTLQRRITEEGTTFRSLVVEARQELADQLLIDPSIGIDEVACLLGYQDTSSFYRAFKEWQGTTPNRWRTLSDRPAHSALH
ncbi:AraC family transcriptional regulator ligand-binding domain-containing protein [Sphingomonas sp. UYP23]